MSSGSISTFVPSFSFLCAWCKKYSYLEAKSYNRTPVRTIRLCGDCVVGAIFYVDETVGHNPDEGGLDEE